MIEMQRHIKKMPAVLAMLGVLLAVGGAAGEKTMTDMGAVGFYAVHRTPTPITIDGRLDEPAWQFAEQINGFERILSDYGRVEYPTRARMLWDDDHLYIGFAALDPDIWAIYTQRNDPLWTEEVVEVFIDPDGSGKNYLELEVNPLNAVVDLKVERAYPRLQASVDWDIAGLQTAVQIYGTVNDSLSRDYGWTVEIAIPWTALEGEIDGGQRPEPGDEWRLNLYRIERTGGRRLKENIEALKAGIPPLETEKDSILTTVIEVHGSPEYLSAMEQNRVDQIREELVEMRMELETLQDLHHERTEYTAWTPTWRQGFHHPERFGVVRFVE